MPLSHRSDFDQEYSFFTSPAPVFFQLTIPIAFRRLVVGKLQARSKGKTSGLIIRNNQAEVFRAYLLEGFRMRLASFLCDHFSHLKRIPADELHAIVANQMEKALRYNLVTDQQITVYAVAACSLGWEFDSMISTARLILTSTSPTAAEKAMWLRDWTLEELLSRASSKSSGASDEH